MPTLDLIRDVVAAVLALAAVVGLLWRAFRVRQRIDSTAATVREHAERLAEYAIRLAALEPVARSVRAHGRQLDEQARDVRTLRVEQVTLATELRAVREDLAQAWASIRALNESAMRRAGNGDGHAGTLASGGDHAADASDRKHQT